MPGVPSSRACDACRQQKKKCDESNPKCSRCTRLQIPCINNGARRFKFQELKFTPSKPQEHHTGSPAIIVAPHTAYKADGSQPRVTNPKAKRASHNKARNGVQYLQDPEKPPKPQNAAIWAFPVVANHIPSLPDKNSKELRSFHFFVDVTAPSLGAAFNSTFWKTEIPRACHLDDAIWHAIISLASAHESSVSTVPVATSTTPEILHTLKHYKLAVQNLLK
ncbi:hypothetical protein PEXP_080790 [Penicillium expansum]|nr:hypothetical protein PEXP_080790 [Penicillium expansum]